MKSIQIECGDVKETIHINKTYAIIDLNPNCKIISDEFTVHEIKENIAMTYHAEPFKVKTFNIGNPSYYEFEDLKNQHTDLKKRTLTLESSQSKLDEDIKNIVENDATNQLRVGGIEDGMEMNNNFTRSFGSLSILAIIGAISFFIILCIRTKTKKRGLNFSIKNVSGQRDPEKNNEDGQRDPERHNES